MITRWFILPAMIGFLILSGCQSQEPPDLNPVSVIRWVNSLIKQKPKTKPSVPGVKMRMELKLEQ